MLSEAMLDRAMEILVKKFYLKKNILIFLKFFKVEDSFQKSTTDGLYKELYQPRCSQTTWNVILNGLAFTQTSKNSTVG